MKQSLKVFLNEYKTFKNLNLDEEYFDFLSYPKEFEATGKTEKMRVIEINPSKRSTQHEGKI